MSPATYHSLLMLALGFSVAGLLSSGYQAVMARPPSFRLLGRGFGRTSLRTMPFVTFAAPFIIIRNIVRARGAARQRFLSAMLATVVAGCWSHFSGSTLIFALRAVGFL
jgi:hypothetical protein